MIETNDLKWNRLKGENSHVDWPYRGHEARNSCDIACIALFVYSVLNCAVSAKGNRTHSGQEYKLLFKHVK